MSFPPMPSSTPQILWPTAAGPARLHPGDVHLWCADLDAVASTVETLGRLLCDDERRRAQSLHFERDRQRFVAARALLREILARYLAVQPADLRFGYGPLGKPAVAGPAAGGELQFNLSHSGALALYAVTWREPVGVDLEQVRPMEDLEAIATHYFSPSEANLLRRRGPRRHHEAFFQLWTQKEARAKAEGAGLDASLTADGAMGAPPRRAAGGPRPRAPQHPWIVTRLHPAAGYAAAVALAGPHPRLGSWQWISAVAAEARQKCSLSCA